MPVGDDAAQGGTDAGASPTREMLPRWRVKMFGYQPVVVHAVDEEQAKSAAARALGYMTPSENTQVLRLPD